MPRRPLLVIDGDSFARRSYHALPKTILRRGRKPAGAILGFANMLLRLYTARNSCVQLDVLPEFVAACGFQNAKAPGFEADDFLAAAAAKEEKRGGTVSLRAATATRSSLPPTAPPFSIQSARARWRA